jgi:hypothetical protein
MNSGNESLRVLRLAYRALPTPFRRLDEPLDAAAGEFATQIGRDAKPLLAAHACDDYAIAATLNSAAMSDPDHGREDFTAGVAAAAGRAPDYLVNVYECVSWAMALRYAAHKARATGRARTLLLQVVDADLHGIQAAWRTRTYGFARFGITSLVLEVDADGVQITTGMAPVDRSMMKFGTMLRASLRDDPGRVLAVPFFPEPTRSAFRKTIPGLEATEDLHDRYGHCFGSDPWIALGRKRGGSAARSFLLGSLALSGYFGLARVGVADAVDCAVEEVA